MEVLFKGPLSELTDAVKCNYVIYWSGDQGMDLVDKWTTERSINDGNKNNLKIYWDKFEEYIHPKTNKLIAVVELKVILLRYFKPRGLPHKGFKTSHSSWLYW